MIARLPPRAVEWYSATTAVPTRMEYRGPVPRVLHLSSELGLRGGERQLLLLAAGLAERGVAQSVAAPVGSALADRTSALGLPLIPLAPRPVLHPRNLVRLVRWLRDHPGVVAHAHTSPTLSLVALARSLAPTTVVHTRRVAYPLRVGRKYRTAADHYVAISRAIAEQLLAGGLEASRLSVIPSAVDLAAVDAVAVTRELSRADGCPLVGCVGALTREKGHLVLLRAWSAVLEQCPRARLVLLGDGPERAAVERATAALPAGSVLLAGYREDVPAWLKALDLYVQPSLAEGLGSAVLEAMACRLPVVASRVGGLPDAVVDGTTGLLCPPGDAATLADAILTLLRSRERATAMGAKGRERVEERFSAVAMVGAYLELYRTL